MAPLISAHVRNSALPIRAAYPCRSIFNGVSRGKSLVAELPKEQLARYSNDPGRERCVWPFSRALLIRARSI
jgi:hypothetical protein